MSIYYFLMRAQLFSRTSIRKPEHSPRSVISSSFLNIEGSATAVKVQMTEDKSLPVTSEMLSILFPAEFTEAIVPDTSSILFMYFFEADVSFSSNAFRGLKL